MEKNHIQDNKQFQFIKILASAGSGKTHTLAKKACEILLRQPAKPITEKLKGILAVQMLKKICAITFTNKAAHELKRRILEKIKECNHDIYPYLLFNSDKVLIDTIDSLLVRVFEPLLMLFNMKSTWGIEIDTEKAKKWILQELLSEYLSNTHTHQLINNLLEEDTEDEPFKHLINSLQKWIKHAVETVPYITQDLLSPKQLAEALKNAEDSLLSKLKEEIKSCESPLPQFLQNDLEHLSGHKLFEKLIIQSGIPIAKLRSELRKAQNIMGLIYFLKEAINPMLNAIQMTAQIQNKLAHYRNTNSVILLRDVPHLLISLIREYENALPFMYEFLGSRVLHYLVDEFQDTSIEQYEALKPLWKELKDNNEGSLTVVGDIKQCIYQWRDAEPQIMANRVDRDFGKPRNNNDYLRTNHRSVKPIVRFNNWLFGTALPRLIIEELCVGVGDKKEKFVEVENKLKNNFSLQEYLNTWYAYEKVEQEPAKDTAAGGVVVRIIEIEPKNKKSEVILQDMVSLVKELHEKGIPYSDILVLERGNKELQKIAEGFLQAGIPIAHGGAMNIQEHPSVPLFFHLFKCAIVRHHKPPTTHNLHLIEAYAWLARQLASTDTPALNNAYQALKETIDSTPPDTGTELPVYACILASTLLEKLKEKNILPKNEALWHEGLNIFINFLWMCQLEGITTPEEIQTIWEETQKNKDARDKRSKIGTHSDTKLYTMDAIELRTIHNAKGYQKPIVLVPLLNEIELRPSWGDSKVHIPLRTLAPLLSEQNIKEVSDEMTLSIPAKYTRKIAHALYYYGTAETTGESIISEIAKTYIEYEARHAFEALNLLYVALTRAEKALFIWVTQNSPKENSKKRSNSCPTTLAQYITKALSDLHLPLEGECTAFPTTDTPHSGTDNRLPILKWLYTFQLEQTNTAAQENHSMQSVLSVKSRFSQEINQWLSSTPTNTSSNDNTRTHQLGEHIRWTVNTKNIKAKAKTIFSEPEIEKGIYLHKLLARVTTINHIDHLPLDESHKQKLKNMLSNNLIKEYFSSVNRWEHQAEKTFFYNGQLLRLDRLLLDSPNKKAVIIDFKCTQLQNNPLLEEWNKHLKHYLKGVQELYKDFEVKGYIVGYDTTIEIPTP